MKALIFTVLGLLIGTQSMAAEPTLTCKLVSGKDIHSVSLELKEGYTYQDEYTTTGEDFDLGLVLDSDCAGRECQASLVITSQIVEDEVGSTGFKFQKSAEGVVYKEKLENVPDKRKYTLICTIVP